jgi:hypothetical protein
MRDGFGLAAVVLLTVLTGSGACSDGDEPGGGSGGSSGSAGSSGTSAGSSGSSGAGGSSGGTDGGPQGDFLDRMAAAQCDALFTCAELRKDLVIELIGGRERCPAVLKRILQSDPRNRERMRELARGSLTLNDRALEACLAFQRSCSLAERDIFQPCREVLEGTVERGGSCRFDDECAGDAYCTAAAGAGCPGTCAPRLPAGSACGRDGDCAGRYSRCDSDSTTGIETCRDLTVVEGVALGARCGDTSATEVGVCRPELWCGDGGGGQRVCRELIAPGGPCQGDFDVCAAGYFCNGEGPPGACQPVTIAREGELCDIAALTACDLYGGLFCVAGRCERTGDGEVGTRCGTDTFNCDLGLHCDRTTDTCQPELAPGESCTSRLQCSSGTCGNDSRCAAVYCGL